MYKLPKETTRIKLEQLVLLALGLGYFLELIKGGPISAYLLMYQGFSPVVSVHVESIYAYVLLIMSLLSLFQSPFIFRLIMGLMIGLIAYAGFYAHGGAFGLSNMLGGMLRAIWPMLMMFQGNFKSHAIRIWLGSVFLLHGLQACFHSPAFLDYILNFVFQIGQTYVDQGWVECLLIGIGLVDLVVAGILWFRPNTPVLLWAIFWILLTFAGRFASLQLQVLPDLFVRSSYLYAGFYVLWRINPDRT
ncbi:MAG: hypothetical protein ACK417_05095 [Bacteroidia bacterium]